MWLILYITFGCFFIHNNFGPVSATNATNEQGGFGYHCVSDIKLPYEEIRNVCSKLSMKSDNVYMHESKIDGVTCSRVPYGSQGPCGEYKVFIPSPLISNCGVCVCNDNDPRKLLYHPPTDKCYYIYEQGFCPEGSIIALNHTAQRLRCTQNPCYSDNVNQLEFKGKCMEFYTRAEECKVCEFLGFEWDNPEPKCTKEYQVASDADEYFSEDEDDIPPEPEGTLPVSTSEGYTTESPEEYSNLRTGT